MNNLVLNKKVFIASLLLILSIALTLTGCESSEDIHGKWYAQDAKGNNITIEFTKDKAIIDGEEYSLEQNATGVRNNTRYFGIKIDEKIFSVVFPDKEDKKTAIMMIPNTSDPFEDSKVSEYLKGRMEYALSKDKHPNYWEYAKKYLH